MIDTYFAFNTLVVGSGAAGLNAANELYDLGQTDLAIVTEGLQMGTSRNTGSDKQTYYKLSLVGGEKDSIRDLAETLYSGGAMDGDLALVEAALSVPCFYNLVRIGVPFPHNRWGEYVGYKTDHDPLARATSAGPLTSKLMVERLLDQVQAKSVPIFQDHQAIAILTDSRGERALGLLALNLKQLAHPRKRFTLFSCTNIIYATGGPAGIYSRSVYPKVQTGATGIALEAGVEAKNLTEWQFGIASLQPRWNLSGTYQQVLPRYISTDQTGGGVREFLGEFFPTPGKMLDAIFLKGYQWPFDPRKLADYGSSLIDVLVYQETVSKNRRVYLDFSKNPTWRGAALDFNWLGAESYHYLERSGALFGTPIQRLAKMNTPAIELYHSKGVDLKGEWLEIAVCAQHNNGGLAGNEWWESNLKHFFPIGEVNGSHGIYRPGGSALNAGQTGGMRAGQFIFEHYGKRPLSKGELIAAAGEQIRAKLELVWDLTANLSKKSTVFSQRNRIGALMDQAGAHIRSLQAVKEAQSELQGELQQFRSVTKLASTEQLGIALQNYDLLIASLTYLQAIRDYIERGGASRGSFLVSDPQGDLPLEGLPAQFRFRLAQDRLRDEIQLIKYKEGECRIRWRKAHPIPEEDAWFENIWAQFRAGEIIK